MPFARVYSYLVRRRQNLSEPRKSEIPVICVGNLVMGGAGKTPVALSLGEIFKGHNFHFLTRGYKGSLKGPVRVDPKTHTVSEVGDEALLLARTAPTWVARERWEGAQAAVEEGASGILMDDGFQNFQLQKDLSFIVVDGRYGLGNGKIFPAGPLREDPEKGLERADALILVGKDLCEFQQRYTLGKPLFKVRYTYLESEITPLKNLPLIAFAGIGHPEKFFQGLQDQGLQVLDSFCFSDHHVYTLRDSEALKKEAEKHQAQLVTTKKDAVRLPETLREHVKIITIKAQFEEEEKFRSFLRERGFSC